MGSIMTYEFRARLLAGQPFYPDHRGAANCNLSPTRTTNYQFGTFYAGDRLNIDLDGYSIEASNATSTDPSTGISQINGNPGIVLARTSGWILSWLEGAW